MLVVYDSKTGNVERFVKKLPTTVVKVSDDLVVNEPFVIVTYTTGFGNTPESTIRFLERNKTFLRGVSSSGNRVWGVNFAKSAFYIAKCFDVPIINQFELSGTTTDVEEFLTALERLERGDLR
ncbi:class Ib ribonucleoside-diphosphate reductase assembly flavoprotein NrdI [Bacillus subtilis]|uniref:class Ib ribonucleoside-diphosphate reductase assembly flavoprotein NrdI n=1 Tax=Bacillus subtilis TaxID=1423 RepID=UPI0025CA6C8D|nr:class Ib ribonucleoside-diphosphate reductase assembly flavoprotein NrdI [Bacillus subtilis]WCS68046.1 protein NrdI [Bacillus phage vB_BsuM-Goe26]GLI90909.1 protein NrdI [Bacillus subtilis]